MSRLGGMRWGDSLDDDEEELGPEVGVILPPPTVSGPDEKGVKTIVEYKHGSGGDGTQVIRVTRRVRVSKVEKKTYKISRERRNWTKFGDASGQDGSANITMHSREDTMLERVNMPDKTAADKKIASLENKLQSGDNSLGVGSLRDLLYKKRMERQLMIARGIIDAPDAPPDDGPGSSTLGAAGSKGGYVPPSLRGGAAAGGGESMRKPRDENSIRVTNLSEDTREQDLQLLFRPFGPISRIYVAFDRDTGESRGFAFINFMYREHAQMAIDKLDGHGYDSLILRVEWAQPRERPAGGQ